MKQNTNITKYESFVISFPLIFCSSIVVQDQKLKKKVAVLPPRDKKKGNCDFFLSQLFSCNPEFISHDFAFFS